MPAFHNLGNSQENNLNQTDFSTILKDSCHGKHKNPDYHRDYYLKNREKLLAYSHIYYGLKKLLKPKSKKAEKENPRNGVKKFSSLVQAGDIYSNSLIDKKDYVGA
jgi:hypothetical protein